MLSANVYVARMQLYLPTYQKNLLSGMNCPISYSVAGLTEGSENVRRVRSLFSSRLDPDPFFVHTTIMRSLSLHVHRTVRGKKKTTSSL